MDSSRIFSCGETAILLTPNGEKGNEGKKQASSPQGRLNLVSYVLLFLKNMQGNPAENEPTTDNT